MLAVAAIALAPPGANLRSTYTVRWLAVALVLLAAVGRKDRRIALATPVLSGAGGLYMAFDGVARVVGGATPARWVYVAAGLLVVAMSWWTLTRRTDNFDPLMVVAQQLAVGLAAYWLFYQLSALALEPRTYLQESALRAAGNELTLLALALAAVGLGVERTWRPAVERLGWARPAGWQIALGIVLAFVLSLSNIPLNVLMALAMPDAAHAIARISQHVFSGVPAWNFPLIALLAGIGEETMFRGALQPRFGILATAALFALIHVQYGVTPVLGLVFVHGLVYGLVRRNLNTTTAALTHATYDFSAFLNGGGFAMFALIALGLGAYLWSEAAKDPQLVWSTFKRGLVSRG